MFPKKCRPEPEGQVRGESRLLHRLATRVRLGGKAGTTGALNLLGLYLDLSRFGLCFQWAGDAQHALVVCGFDVFPVHM